MKILHIVIIAILSLYGYNGVALPASQTDSASETTLIDSTKTKTRADLDSAKVVDATQLKKITDWKETATTAIDILIICVSVLLLFLVYAFIKLHKTKKNVFAKIKISNKEIEKIEQQVNIDEKLIQKVNNDLANIKAQQKKTLGDEQTINFEELYIKDENANKQISKPLIEDYTDYLSAGRSDADFLFQSKENSAPFCVEYHNEDRSDIGTLKLLTDINNLRTMDNGFRKNMIDMDSSNVTIANASGYSIVSNGSARFADKVWKIENKIKIKLIK